MGPGACVAPASGSTKKAGQEGKTKNADALGCGAGLCLDIIGSRPRELLVSAKGRRYFLSEYFTKHRG